MKRICLLALICVAFIALLPPPALAQDIVVLSSDAEATFPTSIVFSLEAEADAEIAEIELLYRVERRSVVPVSFRVALDFTPGHRVDTSWTWDMLQTGGLPPGVEIEYWWFIKDDQGRSVETSPQTVRFDDGRYDWRSIASDNIILYWYEGSQGFAQELVDAGEGALADMESDIGLSLEGAATFYIYANSWDLMGALVYPDEWTGGVAFPYYDTIAIGIAPGDMDWGQRAIAHELGHLVVHQYVFGPYGGLPAWLDEGLAMGAEGELRDYLQVQLDMTIAADALYSVRSIAGSFPADPDAARLCYAQSYSLVGFLRDSYGGGKIMELLEVFKEGSGYDEGLMAVYGFDMDGLNSEWRESLGLDAEQPLTPPVDAGLGMPYIALIVVDAFLGALLLYFGLHYLRRWR